jgi:hypothetical protein
MNKKLCAAICAAVVSTGAFAEFQNLEGQVASRRDLHDVRSRLAAWCENNNHEIVSNTTLYANGLQCVFLQNGSVFKFVLEPTNGGIVVHWYLGTNATEYDRKKLNAIFANVVR